MSASPRTALARQMAGELPAYRPTPMDALRAARKQLLEAGRLDMATLPAAVGVSRATLYRWVGSREELLGEVLADLGERTFMRALQAQRQVGAERIVGATVTTMRAVHDLPAMRTLLAEEPELTFRLCTSRAGPVQGRIMTRVQAALDEEVAGGRLRLALPSSDIAYLVLRVGESFIYSELITGYPPDFDKAAQALHLLLR
jgi:AcrR family transcriptional regulator